jgi:SagB-type dehydrogenase family enzyme
MSAEAFYRLTELDRTTWPEVRDTILSFAPEEGVSEPRSYPGYPRWPLPRCGPRLWPGLERTLSGRRSAAMLGKSIPSRTAFARLLHFSHGVTGAHGRGPAPSAGGLQAIELYLVNFTDAWLPAGLYHYNRGEHFLAQLAAGADRAWWKRCVPSLELVQGGGLLWVLVGDGARVTRKYGARGWRFLLLEAGHVMQNLCLMSERLGRVTLPLGGFFERDIARAFKLPDDDAVLYLGICGPKET